jgi:predicted dehydrogenase
MNRRDFLATSAAAGLTASAFAQEKGDTKPVAANDKISVALIGCGGMGNDDLQDFMKLKDFEPVALCDVDERQFGRSMKIIERSGRSTGGVKTYDDYRKMLDERKDIDCVIIGTPDHHHAFALIHACHGGKNGQGCDVYCEKPISHNIVEGRAMVNAIRHQKRICQIGTQQRSGQHFIDAVAFVQSGKLGHVYLCKTWITNQTGPEGCGRPEDDIAPPKGVNYDLWLGPAPKRAFNQSRFHGHFRWFQDYGNGLCNDWGVHLNDIILWAMKVHAPTSVFASGGKFEMKDNSDTPDTLDVHYEYPTFTHVYTVRRGRVHGGFGGRGHGMEFVGTEGTLTLDRGGWVVTRPDGSQEKHGGSEQHFAHVKNFLHCLRHREDKPASEIEDMHRATSTCHLANISYKVGRRIYWNGEEEKCYRGINLKDNRCVLPDNEANALLFREPRSGWKLPIV